jgi:hypothetical protein
MALNLRDDGWFLLSWWFPAAVAESAALAGWPADLCYPATCVNPLLQHSGPLSTHSSAPKRPCEPSSTPACPSDDPEHCKVQACCLVHRPLTHPAPSCSAQPPLLLQPPSHHLVPLAVRSQAIFVGGTTGKAALQSALRGSRQTAMLSQHDI